LSLTTIVLADDHHVVRQGVRTLLEAEPAFTVVGEASDGLEAVNLVASMKPLVLIVDLMMPGLSGLEVTRQAKQHSPQTRVVVLSMHASEGYVVEALHNGADAYVLKNANGADVVHAVHEVTSGRRYLSPPLTELAIEAYAKRATGAPVDRYETLTTREREVLQLAAEGRSHREVAVRLGISPRTAEVHRANLLRKLGLHSQTELIRYALKRGLVPMEQ
jgi:two-component system response regulator NreC